MMDVSYFRSVIIEIKYYYNIIMNGNYVSLLMIVSIKLHIITETI